jgi:micrococcal nuclease
MSRQRIIHIFKEYFINKETMGNCISLSTMLARHSIIDSKLENADKSVPLFDFDGYTSRGKVVYIYDGDTVHIVLPLRDSDKLIRIKARLSGIDTPELRVAEQKEKALEAKERLQTILDKQNYMVTAKCGKFDKYGRVLVTLYQSQNNVSINQQLINDGYAYAYDGGTKM